MKAKEDFRHGIYVQLLSQPATNDWASGLRDGEIDGLLLFFLVDYVEIPDEDILMDAGGYLTSIDRDYSIIHDYKMHDVQDFLRTNQGDILTKRNFQKLMELSFIASSTTTQPVNTRNSFRFLDKQTYKHSWRSGSGHNLSKSDFMRLAPHQQITGEPKMTPNHCRILEVAFEKNEPRPLVWNAVPTVGMPKSTSTGDFTMFCDAEALLKPWIMNMGVLMARDKLRTMAHDAHYPAMLNLLRMIRSALMQPAELDYAGEAVRPTAEDQRCKK